ncbi:biotin synthase BioB [Beggiatoa leptomitoformis]|uniref:Biotin synthase n=1 Tax=Beggiatoa leptomitoformis TaxID=288004 RepID=A0A2N9YHF0_9GAMM|nr:biotin synthase BioB [Beggiatoa leptomitoformis]ALG67815.1 biotin synthase BioB [Beggiatoa leptomitoformis]AUI69930.1 biotin synthase BioB [Beggiatoa leptomitoformis]
MQIPLIQKTAIRHDWQLSEIIDIFNQPLNDLLFQAQLAHRAYFDPNQIQLSALLNIKTGACPEDCAYCPQSARYETSVEAAPLMDIASVLDAAQHAKTQGATRFCMGAAWRSPKAKDLDKVVEIVRAVKALNMETCLTLGMLSAEQAQVLKDAGLDYYNHNLDTSPEYYEQIITTRTYQDRLETLENVRLADIKVCCGGIIGMGESVKDRAAMLMTLANLNQHPESVPINQLIKIEGTPLADAQAIDPFDFIRCIATARLLMPASYIRLSAGRTEMDDALQALCFFAGANSIFYGDKLLTTENPTAQHDVRLFERLGIQTVQ